MTHHTNTIEGIKKKVESNEFLYIIYSEYGFKIGISRSPLERLEAVRQGLPSQKCFFIGLYSGEDSLTFEKRLHLQYRNQRISGEWFYLNEENLESIDKYLIKNNFHRMIKLSILWAKYISPSNYFDDNIKIVHSSKKNTPNYSIELNENHLLLNFIQKIDNEFIYDPDVKFVTTSQISEYLKNNGFEITPAAIGNLLRKLNFIRKSRKIDGQSRYGYLVKFKDIESN